jgi:hypothetical protein
LSDDSDVDAFAVPLGQPAVVPLLVKRRAIGIPRHVSDAFGDLLIAPTRRELGLARSAGPGAMAAAVVVAVEYVGGPVRRQVQ